MEKLLTSTLQRVLKYYKSLNDRNVAPTDQTIKNLDAFIEPLPEKSSDADAVIDKLDTLGSGAFLATSGRRFFGFVIGGSYPVSVAANWLATAWDQNCGLYKITPIGAILEQVSIEWMGELLNLPKGTGAGFVTGATVANFTALAAARNAILSQAGWDVEANGLIGAPPVKIIVSEEAHPTLFKSLGMLGFGRERVTKIPVDGQGRMKAEMLPVINGPTIICTQAGNINTGSVDPIGKICDAVQGSKAWVHVDGAFGLWAAASPKYAHLTQGMEKADSWATDGHKWLNVPYDSGFAFVKNPEYLKAAMAIRADYLPASEFRDPSDYTPELSRRARGMEVWATLKHLGREGVAELVERCCSHAGLFAKILSENGLRILNEVVLNQVLVSFGSAERIEKIVKAIQEDGTLWAGPTLWQGKSAMRISVVSQATRTEDVEKSCEAIIRIAKSIK